MGDGKFTLPIENNDMSYDPPAKADEYDIPGDGKISGEGWRVERCGEGDLIGMLRENE
jgi:hypothetical protein